MESKKIKEYDFKVDKERFLKDFTSKINIGELKINTDELCSAPIFEDKYKTKAIVENFKRQMSLYVLGSISNIVHAEKYDLYGTNSLGFDVNVIFSKTFNPYDNSDFDSDYHYEEFCKNYKEINDFDISNININDNFFENCFLVDPRWDSKFDYKFISLKNKDRIVKIPLYFFWDVFNYKKIHCGWNPADFNYSFFVEGCCRSEQIIEKAKLCYEESIEIKNKEEKNKEIEDMSSNLFLHLSI